MHSKSNNIEILINDEADEVINKSFDLFRNRYQNSLKSMEVVSLSSIIYIYCIMNVIK